MFTMVMVVTADRNAFILAWDSGTREKVSVARSRACLIAYLHVFPSFYRVLCTYLQSERGSFKVCRCVCVRERDRETERERE